MFSNDLVNKLAADTERPWAEFRRGKEITPKQLARLLGNFVIVSETVWIDGKSRKGYKRSAFEDAWKRYLDT
jgi:putative DNA primase/helicase